MGIDATALPIDLPRLKAIIHKVGYRGFLPFELAGKFDDLVARREEAASFRELIQKEAL